MALLRFGVYSTPARRLRQSFRSALQLRPVELVPLGRAPPCLCTVRYEIMLFPTMSEFKEGIYDQLVTRRVREFLDREPGLRSAMDALEEADSPDYLARHLIRQIKATLRGMPSEDRQQRQIELANTLLAFLHAKREDSAETDSVDPPGKLLRAIYRSASPPVPPSTPLSATSLLMNALDEPRLGFELERELATADRVFMVVSVSHTGSRPMSIYWDLEHPMPAWFFEICASLRAA